jgi:hypothetical protein
MAALFNALKIVGKTSKTCAFSWWAGRPGWRDG